MSFQYSHNNHYKWGWGNEWFNDPIVGEKLNTSIGSCIRPHESFRTEVINTATLLANQFTKPLIIGLSGGFDSQVACLAFREIKYEFRPMILTYVDNSNGSVLNEHDISAAYEFCKKFNLDPMEETLNLEQFYVEQAYRLSKEHCLMNLATMVQLYPINKYNSAYSYIMAGGDPRITFALDKNNEVLLVIDMGGVPIQQHLVKNRYEGVTKFFMYTPELLASFVDHDVVRLLNIARVTITESYESEIKDGFVHNSCYGLFYKPLLYVEQWPELIQRKKYTGFESYTGVQKHIEVLRTNRLLGFTPTTIRYDDLLNHLLTGHGSEKIWKSNAGEFIPHTGK